MTIPDEILLEVARPLLFMSLLGVLAALLVGVVFHTRTRGAEERLEAAHCRVDEIDAVPLPDPEVDAITGELEIVHVCPHLSRFDLLDGLSCPECYG